MFEEKPIEKGVAVAMVSLAVAIDGIQFLISFVPVLGDVVSAGISLFAFLTYYLWFKVSYGIDFSSSKRLLVMLSASVVETIGIFIPTDLPGLTGLVLFTILTAKLPAVTKLAQGDVLGAISAARGSPEEDAAMESDESASVPQASEAPDRSAAKARASRAALRLKSQQSRIGEMN